jgi:hypothetical protein
MISNKGTIGADIADLDIEGNISDSDESFFEMENKDSISGLLEDTHIKDAVDFGGCTNSAYEIFWDDVTTSWGNDRKKNSIFLVCKQISTSNSSLLKHVTLFSHSLCNKFHKLNVTVKHCS